MNADKMRITIDIDENKLRSIQKWTGEKKMSPAIAIALDEYLLQKQREAFLAKVEEGEVDYSASNDEVERLAHPEI